MKRTFFSQLKSWLEPSAFFLVVAFALVVRQYHVDWPLGDWHSFRQADTASVTREYVKHGVDLLRPRYHDISNIQSGKDNPDGWRMVEFPIVNAVIASVVRANPSFDLVVVSRLFSIGASILSLCLWWMIVRDFYGRGVAFVTALVFAFMPYSIFYSRVILPEPFLVLFLLLTTWFLSHWAQHSVSRWKPSLSDLLLLGAGFSWALALLIKPVAIFYAPLFLAIVWHYQRWSLADIAKMAMVFCAGFVPVWWWREWIQQFPTGVPVSTWLLNGNGIRLRPAWWRWLFGDRFGRLMFGNWSAGFLAIGAAVGWMELPSKKFSPRWSTFFMEMLVMKEAWVRRDGLVLGSILGILSYFVVIATGNVQHDYYQTMVVPLVALLWARAVVWLIEQGKTWVHSVFMVLALAVVAGFSAVFAWYDISGFYNINNPAIVSAGESVRRNTPNDALIIAPYFGDTSFLFQTDRRGWPLGFEIDDKISKGATFYVTTSQDDEANELLKKYRLVEKTKEFILLDLTQPAAK